MEDGNSVVQAIADLTSEFKLQTAGMPAEIVKKCHPWNFTAPCHVVVLWTQDGQHDITIVGPPFAKSSRVEIHGPLKFPEVVPAMELLLKDSLWDSPAPDDEDALVYLTPIVEPGKIRTLRHLQVRHYGFWLNTITSMLFHRAFPAGEGTSDGVVSGLRHLEFQGDLGSINPKERIAQMIRQAKYDHEQYLAYLAREHAHETPSTGPPAPEPSDGIWTCLHPWVAVGPQPDRDVWGSFTGRNRELFSIPRSDIRAVPGTNFHVTREGYVLVESQDLRHARRALNHLVFLLNRNGVHVMPIGPKQTADFRFDPTGTQAFGAFRSLHGVDDPARNKPTTNFGPWMDWRAPAAPQSIPASKFDAIASTAWGLASSPWANEVEWLMDAESYAADHRFSVSLLTSWLGIERIVYRLLDDHLANLGTPPAVRESIGKRRYDDAIKLANDLGTPSIPQRRQLRALFDLRNQIAHKGKEADGEQANEGIAWLRSLVEPLAHDVMTQQVSATDS